MKVKLSVWQRAHDLAFPSAAKNISNYAGARIAMLEVKSQGFDNVVLAKADGLSFRGADRDPVPGEERPAEMTPMLLEGVLPSITRALTLDIATELGIPAVELTRTDAWMADEAFLCCTGTGLEYALIGQITAFC